MTSGLLPLLMAAVSVPVGPMHISTASTGPAFLTVDQGIRLACSSCLTLSTPVSKRDLEGPRFCSCVLSQNVTPLPAGPAAAGDCQAVGC
jgi:hypothetical protein